MGQCGMCACGAHGVSISNDTRELIMVKAKLAKVYADLVLVLNKIDVDCSCEHAQKLKDSLLDADSEFRHYLSNRIDIQLMESNYTCL